MMLIIMVLITAYYTKISYWLQVRSLKDKLKWMAVWKLEKEHKESKSTYENHQEQLVRMNEGVDRLTEPKRYIPKTWIDVQSQAALTSPADLGIFHPVFSGCNTSSSPLRLNRKSSATSLPHWLQLLKSLLTTGKVL